MKKINSFDDMLYEFSLANQVIREESSTLMERIASEGLAMLSAAFTSYGEKKKWNTAVNQDLTVLQLQPNKQETVHQQQRNQNKIYCSAKATNGQKQSIYKKWNQQLANIEENCSQQDTNLLPDFDNKENIENSNSQETKFTQQTQQTSNDIFTLLNKSLSKHSVPQQENEDAFSSYSLTDYSSNESSNQDQEEFHYEEEGFSLGLIHNNKYGKVLKKNTSIMNSAKKKPRMRLYKGRKKIPEWAQDLKKVEEEHSKISEEEVKKLFKVHVVENLNTNLIFQQELNIVRTSSAKWDPKSFLF